MRNTIKIIDPTKPIIQENRVMEFQFRTFVLEVQQRGLIIGTGSPEGVVEANQGQEYMDDTGTAGNIKYIKKFADVGGDRTLGWILI